MFEPFLIIKVPDGETTWMDLIHKKIKFDNVKIDDQVLMKSDQYPTYHLANVVDDHLMKISHVIRGDEWIPSTPKHIMLYSAFGWEHPTFGHLPLILNPDRTKVSKRQGDVSVHYYQKKGFLPESLQNFVALLGWTPVGEQEIFSPSELIQHFSFERVHKSPAVANIDKLTWINDQHLRNKIILDISTLINELKPLLEEKFGKKFDDEYIAKVVNLMKERIKIVQDVLDFCYYFFTDPLIGPQNPLHDKMWKDNSGIKR